MNDNIKQKSTIYKTHLKNRLQIVGNYMKTINNISFTKKLNQIVSNNKIDIE